MYFWTWNTEEVLEMIKWMREFNQSGKGRVQFTGFDMQTPDVAAAIVRDFVTKNDTAYEGDLQKAIEVMKVTPQMGVQPSALRPPSFRMKLPRVSACVTAAISRPKASLKDEWILDHNPSAKIVLRPRRP